MMKESHDNLDANIAKLSKLYINATVDDICTEI